MTRLSHRRPSGRSRLPPVAYTSSMVINDADYISIRIKPSDLERIAQTGVPLSLADKPCFECGRMFTPIHLARSRNHKWCSERCGVITRDKRAKAGLDANG